MGTPVDAEGFAGFVFAKTWFEVNGLNLFWVYFSFLWNANMLCVRHLITPRTPFCLKIFPNDSEREKEQVW